MIIVAAAMRSALLPSTRTRAKCRRAIPARSVAQPRMGADRGLPCDVHAGRLRDARDRLHPRQERGQHDGDELHHLSDRHRRILAHRLRPDDGRGRRTGPRSARPGSSITSFRSASADMLMGCSARASSRCSMLVTIPRASRCSCSRWSSWIPRRPFRPARWRSAGSFPPSSLYGFFMSMFLYPSVWQLGVGRRMALAARREPRTGTRARRLRRILGGAYDRRIDRAGRRDRARTAHRQVSPRRTDWPRSPATTFRWRWSAPSSSRSDGSASTRARRWRPRIRASG